MKPHVFVEVRWITEGPLTESTLERFISGVGSNVDFQPVSVIRMERATLEVS